MRRTFVMALTLTIVGCGGSNKESHGVTAPATSIVRQVLTDAVGAPMQYVVDPTNRRLAYVLDRPGSVRVLIDDVLQDAKVLDLTGVVVTEGECGLQGMTFAPDFATSRAFYLQYNTSEGGELLTRITRFRMGADGLSASSVGEPVLKVVQPFTNHKGGTIHFGGDGLLYVALGDGGSGNDPGNRAQDPTTLLGKVSRIDPSGDDLSEDPDNNYRIPTTNPFVAETGTRSEIWDFGMRNPFRWSVDSKTKGLVFADVGQDAYEEVDFEPAGKGGRNYGWSVREGLHPTTNPGPARPGTLTDPFFEYDHSVGHSITGGYVVRKDVLGLEGRYLAADFVDNKLWSIPLTLSSGEAIATSLASSVAISAESAWSGIVSIDPDADGKPVVTELLAHRVSRLVAP